MRLVLEGVTGTGKSHTLAAMRRAALLPPCVVSEDETFGEAMLEAEAGEPSAHVLRRLSAVVERLERERPGAFVLERAHPSYVAVGLPWEACDAIDARLASLGACVVVLVVPEDHLRTRSLLRREYDARDWQALAAHYGSEDAALAALARSQRRRLEVQARSRLPHRVVDTRHEDWDAVAQEVAAFAASCETSLTSPP